MPTYTEDVKGGESRIVCSDCGRRVTNELRHERWHVSGPPPHDEGVEEAVTE